MTRTDYILLYTSRLLSIPEPLFTTVLNHFATHFELNELCKPAAVSLGGRIHPDVKNGYTDWLNQLRSEHITEVQFFQYNHAHTDLAPHIAHAFAGSQDLLMHIVTDKRSDIYVLQTILGPYYDMTAIQFKALIEAQSNPDLLWKRIAELLLQSNELNQLPLFDANAIREIILQKDMYLYDSMLSQLLSEVQIETLVSGSSFVVPEHLQYLVYQSDLSFGGYESDDSSEQTYVYLYPLKEVNGKELQALVDAQPFSAAEIWEGTQEAINQYIEPVIPQMTETEWPLYIENKNAEECRVFSGIICRSIATLCEKKHIDKIIPDALAECFGPNELDNKRAQARSKMDKSQWLLQSAANPWEMYFFEQVANAPLSEFENKTTIEQTFRLSLEEIAAFAKRIESPFQEAFSLSLYFLGKDVSEGIFDPLHLQSIKADLLTKGFSERALQNVEDPLYYGESMALTGMPVDQLYKLLAVIIVKDLFGGMGSWNDQYMEHETDQEEYMKRSENVFQNAIRSFAALLSSTAK